MNRYMLICFALYLLAACTVRKPLLFKAGTDTYTMIAPPGYKLSSAGDDHGYREYHLTYPDSSIIYFTNDYKSGGAVNKDKVKRYGDGIYLKILSSDSLDISGEINGKYWREQKQQWVVAGYVNVPPGQKEKYDQVLSTLVKKK